MGLGLLITFAYSLGPGHALQNVGPNLDENCLTLMVSLNICLEKVLKTEEKKHALLSSMQIVKGQHFTHFSDCNKSMHISRDYVVMLNHKKLPNFDANSGS